MSTLSFWHIESMIATDITSHFNYMINNRRLIKGIDSQIPACSVPWIYVSRNIMIIAIYKSSKSSTSTGSHTPFHCG